VQPSGVVVTLKHFCTSLSLKAMLVRGLVLVNGYGGVHEERAPHGVNVGVAVAVGVNVAVAVGVNVAVAVGVNVAVDVGVNVAVAVDVAVGVNVAVGVEVGVAVGTAQSTKEEPSFMPWMFWKGVVTY
jgi:hypothetical protein